MFEFLLLLVIMLCVYYFRKKQSANAGGKTRSNPKPRSAGPTVSSDGHRVPRSEDVTCETRFGHRHAEAESGTRYIVHTEPQEGYMNLNGRIVKVKDADKLVF